MKAPKVTRWPNGLGWSIKNRYGEANIVDMVSKLSVSAPISPVYETAVSGKCVTIERVRLGTVPLGTDPVAAYLACLAYGAVYEICHGVTRDVEPVDLTEYLPVAGKLANVLD